MSITENPKEADTIIVNTCGFLDIAREESIETILQAAQLKQEQANIADTKLTQALINRQVDGKIVSPTGQFLEATQSADEPLTESNLASALKQDMSGVEGFVTPVDRSGV